MKMRSGSVAGASHTRNFPTALYRSTGLCQKLRTMGGQWRDSSAGIGTMTFYDPATGIFGGLGHAVCDVDTGEPMPLSSGEVVPAYISGVKKGEKAPPGSFREAFCPASPAGCCI